jgi:hypothetical protein
MNEECRESKKCHAGGRIMEIYSYFAMGKIMEKCALSLTFL